MFALCKHPAKAWAFAWFFPELSSLFGQAFSSLFSFGEEYIRSGWTDAVFFFSFLVIRNCNLQYYFIPVSHNVTFPEQANVATRLCIARRQILSDGAK